MISNRSLLEHVLVAYRDGDMDECIRLVRTLVEAAPLATAPRQLLASIFAQTGRGRLAIGHYRKLLTAAVARGEVVRAIAFQKQIDAFQPAEAQVADRWAALHRQLRSHDLSFLVVEPSTNRRPWTEAELLSLPNGWFERLAAETRFDYFGIDPRTVQAETGTVWEVLGGRLRWSFALSDGRASTEALAVEGDAIQVAPELARRARLTLVPELPAETLRFDAPLVRAVRAAIAEAASSSNVRAHGRPAGPNAPLPTRPEDVDPGPTSIRPLRLAERVEDATSPAPPKPDSGDWLEFGIVSLGSAADSAAASDSVPAEKVEPPAHDGSESPNSPTPPTLEATGSEPTLGEEVPEPEVAGSAEGEPGPVEHEALESPPGDEAPAPSVLPANPPSERRRHPRVAVSLESRMALLGLTDSPLAPIRGMLADLSTSGLSVRFPTRDLAPTRAALVDAVVAVDLELPGPAGPMRLAAQVRWLEGDEPSREARLGIEFVLLTEPDRRRIAGALARAALAAHAASRKAA